MVLGSRGRVVLAVQTLSDPPPESKGMNMPRLFGSPDRSRSHWSQEVDLGVAGTLESVSGESYLALNVEQRNGLLVRFIASFSGIPEQEVAGEFGVLVGKRFGRGRLSRKICEAWLPPDETRAQILMFVLEEELEAAGMIALQGAAPLAILAVTNVHGGVSKAAAGVVALRSRKLLAMGGRTIGEAMGLGLVGELGAMSPVSIIGPIREQGRVLASEVQVIDPNSIRWLLPSLDEEQELRDRIANVLADRGFVPRLCGSYVFDGRQSWMLGVDLIRLDELPKLIVILSEILREERPNLAEYDSVDLVVCKAWTVEKGMTIPAEVAALFIEGAIGLNDLIGRSHAYADAWMPLPASLSKSQIDDSSQSVNSEVGVQPEGSGMSSDERTVVHQFLESIQEQTPPDRVGGCLFYVFALPLAILMFTAILGVRVGFGTTNSIIDMDTWFKIAAVFAIAVDIFVFWLVKVRRRRA